MLNLRIITLGLLFICCAVLPSQQTSGYSDENHQFTCDADSGIPLQECEALVALYESTDGPNWRIDTGWLVHANPCIWYGVTCAIGHVRNLELSGTVSEDGTEVSNFGLSGPLPAKINNLSQLNRLDLSQNQLEILPAEIGQLTTLETLDLSYNQLITVPLEIGNASNIRYLDISHNQLEKLPDEIGNITYLDELNASHNQLNSVPAAVGALKGLSTLRINDNQLRELPEEIGSLTNIQSLYLGGNQLSALPAAFWYLSELDTLDLSHNQFSMLPDEIGNLLGLIELDLSYNQLRTLPMSLTNLEMWSEVNLGYNHLQTTDRTLLAWMNEWDYDWADTQILDEATPTPTAKVEIPVTTSTPSPDFACANVSEISTDECESLVALYENTNGLAWQDHTGWLVTNMPCSWYGVTCAAGHVTKLDLQGQQDSDFGLTGAIPAAIADLVHLTTLDLSYNQLSILPNQIGNLARLEVLDLHSNQLESLPLEIGSLANLRSLDLSANRLQDLPQEIGRLSNLWHLWLDRNQLESVPTEIGDLINLKKLNLSANPLSTLPSSLVRLTQLNELTLDNPGLQITDVELLAWLDKYFPSWSDASATATPTPAYTATPTAVATTPGVCKGITWVYKKQVDDYTLVGRHAETNAYTGDTDCSESWPLLCLKKDERPVPAVLADQIDYYAGWTGGQLGITEPVSGYALTSLNVANGICESQLGEGWQFGEFHDGNGGWNWWAVGEVPVDVHFWLWIDDQPANPWSYLRLSEPTPIATGTPVPTAVLSPELGDRTPTEVPDAPTGGGGTPMPSEEEAKLTPIPDDGTASTATPMPSPEADVIMNTTEHRLYLPTVRR